MVTALVVVELPTIKLVMLAKVATRLEKNPLVLVALDAMRLVVEKLVELPLVITEEDAKIFWAKRLRKRLAAVPNV